MNTGGFVDIDIILKDIADSYMKFWYARAQVPGHIKPQGPHAGFVFEADADGTLQMIDTNCTYGGKYIANVDKYRIIKVTDGKKLDGKSGFKIKQDQGVPSFGVAGYRVGGSQLVPVSPPEGFDAAGKKTFGD